jgi:subtilisin-like proprotein convertase family protein
VTAANAPFTGSYRPTNALGSLAGAVVDGSWTFFVADVAGGDVGSIRSVALHLNGFVQPAVAGRPSNVHGVTNNGPVHPQ